MSFIWDLVGAMFAVAGGLLALTIAMIILYTVVIAIQSALDERNKKKTKKSKKN